VPSDGSGTGLIGLAERVQLTGGRLSHEALNDGGFALHASLPWA
jgi:signal transduction histidine kinase